MIYMSVSCRQNLDVCNFVCLQIMATSESHRIDRRQAAACVTRCNLLVKIEEYPSERWLQKPPTMISQLMWQRVLFS